MRDDPQRQAGGAGLADPVELEERRPPDQPVTTEPDQQRYVSFEGHQASLLASADQGAGEVDHQPAPPRWPDGQHHHPAGAEQDPAGAKDLPYACQ